jgi:hypothetical protein
VLPYLSLALLGALKLVVGAPKFAQVHPKFSPVNQGVLKLLTTTPMLLLDEPSEIPVTQKAGWNAPLESDSLLKLI